MAEPLQFEVPTALEYFSALVADDATLSLLEAAAAIAQDDFPDLDTQAVLAEVDALDKLKRRIPADAVPVQRLRWLNRFFFQELGFAGNVNDYYDRDNSYLHRVLVTRRGIPIIPSRCCTRNVRLNPMKVSQKCQLPIFSLNIRPDIFGNQ